MWGAGDGAKAAAGGNGHKIVLDVGHLFGAKFKPWGAVRIADNIGKVVKVAGFALPIALEVGSVVREDRDAHRRHQKRLTRRRGLVEEVNRQTRTIVDDALGLVRQQVRPAFNEAYGQIDAVHDEIVNTRSKRTRASSMLSAIQDDARQALDDLTSQ